MVNNLENNWQRLCGIFSRNEIAANFSHSDFRAAGLLFRRTTILNISTYRAVCFSAFFHSLNFFSFHREHLLVAAFFH